MPDRRERATVARRPRAATTSGRSVGSHALRIARYALAFLCLPVLVGAAGVADVFTRLHSHAEPFDADLAPPPHDVERPTAVVLASNVWTEATDFLGPYQVLAASDAYNVVAVAPERALTPLNGAVDVMPHYSIAEFEAAGLEADVLVVPYIADIHGDANRPLLDWIAAHAERGGTILSICAGAEVVAASGAMDGRTATTIWSSVDALERTYPATTWVRDVRYVDDGTLISSAGVTSGIDATIHLLDREQGRDVATTVAAEVGYPHVRFMHDPAQPTPYRTTDLLPMALHGAFAWDRPTLGVALEPGVTELELASVADTYNPATATVLTMAEERRPVETAHGLHVVPRHTPASAPRPDRLLVPGTREAAELTAWADASGIPVAAPHAELGATGSRYAFDATTLDLATQENPAIARAIAASIEYPVEHLGLPAQRLPRSLVVRALVLGLVGAGLLFAAERSIATRRERRPTEGSRVARRRAPSA